MKAWSSFPGILGLLAVLAMAVLGCFEDRVAGGTDEVENPALTATLRDAQGNAVAGSVQLYARYQNPTRNAAPVMTAPAAGKNGQAAVITAKALLAAMDSAQKLGVSWKNRDTVAFNLLGANASDEAFSTDYMLIKLSNGAYRFQKASVPQGLYANGSLSGSLAAALPMRPAVTGYKGQVGAKGVELGLKSLFVPGSPYKTEVAPDGTFQIVRIAPGRYDVKALDKDGKVYSSLDSLGTDKPFSPADWSEADIIWVGD